MGGGVEVHRGKVRLSFRIGGRRYRESLGLKATRANLEHGRRLVAEIDQRIRTGTFDYAHYFPDSRHAASHGKPDPTFSEVAARWARTLEVEASTERSYRVALSAWQSLDPQPIRSIRRSHILEAIKAHGYRSAKTRNNYMVACRAVFAFALADEILERNPCDQIRNAKVQRPEPDPLTLPEVERVLAKMRERYSPQIVHYFAFAFFTGMRPSEIVALRWGDIDWQDGTATVQRARVAGVEKDQTKTHRIRRVELSSRALAALQGQRAYTELAGAEVFQNPVSRRPWQGDKRQRESYWNPTLKALGMRHRDAYQCRHTFATLNLMAGANVMWVAQQMGHANAKMLLERYARWLPRADKGQELAKVEGALKNPPG